MKKKSIKPRLAAVLFTAALILLQSCIYGQEPENKQKASASKSSSTPAAYDNTAPSAPKGLTADNRSYTSISLKWAAASDNTGVKGYEVYRDGRKIITTKKTSYTNTSLIPGRSYTYSIKAYDASGNISGAGIPLAVTTLKDTEIPSAPSNLSAGSATHTTITLTWMPSADNTGIKHYEIYCNDKKVAATSATSYTCKKLFPGNTYSFNVKAYDIAGNYSLRSNVCSAKTAPDTAPPSIPSGLKASSVSATEINLTWLPSSDNVKVKNYEIFRDGIRIGTTSRTSLKSSDLMPGKSYTYAIRACDSVSNMSGKSTQLKVKTLNDAAPPTAPSGLSASSPTRSSVSLKWKASTDDIKVKGYNIYCNGIKIGTASRTSYTVKGIGGLIVAVFQVEAFDLADNPSKKSNSAAVIMLK